MKKLEIQTRINNLINEIHKMYPYRQALVYNAKINYILQQLETIKRGLDE